MKTIIIGGASGAVGTGIVMHCLLAGHQVVAIVRNEAKKEALQTVVDASGLHAGHLQFIVNAYEDEAQISHLQQQLISVGPIDLAIASLGGWYHGPELHQLLVSDWNTVVDNSLSAHFRFAASVMPILEKQRSGFYAFINGGASEYAVPHSGIISVMAAAQKMMGQVMHTEAKAHGVTVVGVAAFALVKTYKTADIDSLWLSAEAIGQYVIGLVDDKTEKSTQYWHKLASPADLLVSNS